MYLVLSALTSSPISLLTPTKVSVFSFIVSSLPLNIIMPSTRTTGCYQLLTSHLPDLTSVFPCLVRIEISVQVRRFLLESRSCVIPEVSLKLGKAVQSNRTVLIKVYLMTVLDNYMFRSILAIFRLFKENLT